MVWRKQTDADDAGRPAARVASQINVDKTVLDVYCAMLWCRTIYREEGTLSLPGCGRLDSAEAGCAARPETPGTCGVGMCRDRACGGMTTSVLRPPASSRSARTPKALAINAENAANGLGYLVMVYLPDGDQREL
jgi:hypothetical protein